MASELGFAEDDLLALAGERSFERGLGYLDAVCGMEIGDGWITATVQGTEAYEVELTEDEEGGILGDCDCPYGQEGHFCKHCVAVGLTVLRQASAIPRQRAAAANRTAGLEAWLQALSHDELLALLREQIAHDRGLRHRLELRAASARSETAVVRERVMAMLDVRPFARYGYVERGDAGAYARQAAEAVDALRALAAGDRAQEAVGLAREAIRALSQAYGEIDDSDGAVGDVARELAEAHLQACGTARPDPAETAEWLVGHLLSDLNDATDIDLVDYRKVLGPAGLARVRELATEAWHRAPNGWAEKYLMERLVKAEGNVDALIAVYAADLAPPAPPTSRSPWNWMRPAERPRPSTGPSAGCATAHIPRTPTAASPTTSVPATSRRVARPRWSRCAGTASTRTAPSPPTSCCAPPPRQPAAGRRNARPPWRLCVPMRGSSAAAGAAPYWSTPCSTTGTWTPPGKRHRAVPRSGSGSPSQTGRRTRGRPMLSRPTCG
ncbi:SWIM zinc finger family protein [Streptomyces violascens]|uniref:SWIM zinc finger family protein n=1 Tax=Streptomyces violascens TaxID=67381 RepID=UPI00365C045C